MHIVGDLACTLLAILAIMVVTLLEAALQVALLVITFSDEASTLLVLLASSAVTLMVANWWKALLESSCWWGIYFSGAFGIPGGHLVGG